MKTLRFARPTLLLLAAATLGAPAAWAARRSDDPLSLVPADAASVAVVRLNELRSSPLSSKLFANADKLTADGDAAKFLAETRLSPKEDVDTVVVAGLPASGGDSAVLVLFEGRFDPDRLAAAAEARGALRRSAPGGDYELLPEKDGSSSEKGERGKPGAAAFVSRNLVIAGTESAVIAALAAREGGGTRFSSGAGLGRQLARIDRGAAAWALVDVTRNPALQKKAGHVHVEGEGGAEPAAALASAMKSVSFFAVEATPHGDSLEFAATGLAADAETRQLLEDSLRGLLAIWRLAVQEKSPELVSALRRFKVGGEGEAVTIRGTLPGSVLRALSEKRRDKEN
jgi:hypothetical protein